MARIVGIDGMTHDQLNAELADGARFVVYQYCVSVIVITFRRPTDIYFIRGNESAVVRGLGYVAMTFFLGWWGFPWGPIYSVQSLYTNLSGGKDVTHDVLDWMNQEADPGPSPGASPDFFP